MPFWAKIGGMNESPLVSCLMVTSAQATRLGFIEKSVRCFLDQTYPSRELVIVLDQPKASDKSALMEMLASLGASNIRVVEVSEKKNLGSLRNRSISEARGSILCGWDDDDISHRRRLQFQYDGLVKEGADVTYLQNVFHFFPSTKELFLTNWSKLPHRQGHPASLMFKKECAPKYPEEGPESQKGEDVVVLEWFRAHHKVAFLNSPPSMYVYIFHGGNTWQYDHHKDLALVLAESREFLVPNFKAVSNWIKEARLNEPMILLSDSMGPVQMLVYQQAS